MNVHQEIQEMKIRVIGDYNIGRRSLIIAVDRKFELDPDVFINPGMVDSFLIKMKWDGTPYSVYIDMDPCAGEPEDIEMIRRMCFSCKMSSSSAFPQ